MPLDDRSAARPDEVASAPESPDYRPGPKKARNVQRSNVDNREEPGCGLPRPDLPRSWLRPTRGPDIVRGRRVGVDWTRTRWCVSSASWCPVPGADPEPNRSTLKWGGALTVTGGSRLGVNVLVDNFVGEALLGIDWTGRVEPRLAVSWQWSADHLRLELTIRSGVQISRRDPGRRVDRRLAAPETYRPAGSVELRRCREDRSRVTATLSSFT